MKCPECDGVGRIHYGEEWCSACNGTGEVQTNEEWLRMASMEQLAEVLVGVARYGGDAFKRCNGSFEPLNIYKHEFWVEWLKQPHAPIS